MRRSRRPTNRWFTLTLLAISGCTPAIERCDASLFHVLNTGVALRILDPLMLLFGEKLPLALAGGALYLAWLTTGRWRYKLILAMTALLLIGGVDFTATAVKKWVARPRPCHVLTDVRTLVPCSGSFSFPSNHAANAFAAAVFIALATERHVLLWLGLGALVGFSRIYVGVHYPLDVLGGMLIGGLLAVPTGLSFRWLKRGLAGASYAQPRTGEPGKYGSQ